MKCQIGGCQNGAVARDAGADVCAKHVGWKHAKAHPMQAHESHFRLSLFTTDQRVTAGEWEKMVGEAVLEAEMSLNKTGRIRAHIFEDHEPSIDDDL